MENRILVRADGGRRIGFGHWSRCLFLLSCYHDIAQAHEIILFTNNAQEFAEAYPAADIKVVPLSEEEAFFVAVKKDDIILLDDYHLTPDYFSRLQKKEAFLIYVDDLLKPGIKADIIINHSLGVKATDYHLTAPYCSYYLGSDYSMVPELFKRHKQAKENSNRLNHLLLCMGGSDPTNETARLLTKHQIELKSFEQVYIITGPQYPFHEALKKEWGTAANFQFLHALDKTAIGQLMQECGTAILPASTMAVEYAHIGGLLGIIKTADNQERLQQGLLREGVAIDIGEVFKTKDKVALYQQLTKKQQQQFDGLSQQRFRKLFSEINTQRTLQLRAAKAEDSSLTYKWASDKRVRAFSFSKENISWEGHQQWFSKKIKELNCIYLIAEIEQLPVGSIRFDIENKEAVISYLIDSSSQGKGLGRIILAEGVKYLLKNDYSIDSLIGYVMEENKASVRIFERMGFETVVEEGRLKYIKRIVHA